MTGEINVTYETPMYRDFSDKAKCVEEIVKSWLEKKGYEVSVSKPKEQRHSNDVLLFYEATIGNVTEKKEEKTIVAKEGDREYPITIVLHEIHYRGWGNVAPDRYVIKVKGELPYPDQAMRLERVIRKRLSPPWLKGEWVKRLEEALRPFAETLAEEAYNQTLRELIGYLEHLETQYNLRHAG